MCSMVLLRTISKHRLCSNLAPINMPSIFVMDSLGEVDQLYDAIDIIFFAIGIFSTLGSSHRMFCLLSVELELPFE